MSYSKSQITEYLNALASSNAIPGGGSASALLGSMAISLNLMVAKIISKKMDKNEAKEVSDIIKDFNLLKKTVLKVVDKDPICYQKVIDAYSLPKTNPKRTEKIEKSLTSSYEIMRNLAVDLSMAKKLNRDLSNFAKGAIANDLKVSLNFLQAAFKSAIDTAKINIAYMKNEYKIKEFKEELKSLKKLFK